MELAGRARIDRTNNAGVTGATSVPGKRTLSERLRMPLSAALAANAPAAPPPATSSGPRPTLQMLFGMRTPVADDPAQVHAAAQRGTASPATRLPHADRIQRAFGRHDISGIQAHVGDDAAASAQMMGAQAYATGHHVVLGGGTDLHTVAHEAAHVVQQRAGVQLKGGVGAAGDPHEHHADAVADRVVRGESAEDLLDGYAGGTGTGAGGVQRKGFLDRITDGLGGAQATFVGYVARALPANPMAVQIITSVPIEDKLAGALNVFGAKLIESLALDQLVAGVISAYASAGATAILAVLAALDPLVAAWNAMPEAVQHVLIFLVGRFLQIAENFIVKMATWTADKAKEETGKTGEVVNTHAITTWLLEPLASSTKFAASFRLVSQGLRTFFGGAPVSSAWQAWGSYVSHWLVGKGWSLVSWLGSWIPRGSTEPTTPPPVEDSAKPGTDKPVSGTSTTAPPKPGLPGKVPIGPMAILPKKFGIAKTETDKLGGLEVAAGLEFNFLQSNSVVPQLDAAARVDWDGKFSWNAALSNVPLLARADLGFLAVESIALDRIEASDQYLALSMSAARIKIGSVLDTGKVAFTWNSRTGLTFTMASVALTLPDPLAKVSGNLAMQIDKDGKLGLFEVTQLAVGDKFEIARAAYTENRFALENARYHLPADVLGPRAWLGFGAELSKDGELEKVEGSVAVDDLRPFNDDSFVIGGTMAAGYNKTDKFTFSLSNGRLAARYKAFAGNAQIQKVEFKQASKSFTADVPSIDVRLGIVQAELVGAKFDNKLGLRAAKGSLRFVAATEKNKVPQDLDSLPHPDSDHDWLKYVKLLGSVAGQVMSADIINPRFTHDKGLAWDQVKLAAALPGAARINLFGGLLTGMYDRDKKTATIGSHFSYPPAGSSLLPKLAAEFHFVPGLGVFVELGITGGLTAGVETRVEPEKDTGELGIHGKVSLSGSLGVALGAGLMAGSNLVVALRSYLQGSATLTASGDASFHGRLIEKPGQGYSFQAGTSDGKILDYAFASKLVAQVSVVIDVAAFMTFSKQIARVNLKTWDLGNFNVKGQFKETPAGKLEHQLLAPNKDDNGKNTTFGGAFDTPPKLDQSALEPLPVDVAIDLLDDKKAKLDDPRMVNRLLTDIEDALHLGEPRKNHLRKRVLALSNVSDAERDHTTARGAKKKLKGSQLIPQLEQDAFDYKQQRKTALGVISRIMTRPQWEKYSDMRKFDSMSMFGSAERKTVVPIDEAVGAFHAIAIPVETKPELLAPLLAQRLDKLERIETACDTYLSKSGDRSSMVRSLRQRCTEEREQLELQCARASSHAPKQD